jgi:hypothetical protein
VKGARLLNLRHPRVSQILLSCTSPGVSPYISLNAIIHVQHNEKRVHLFLPRSLGKIELEAQWACAVHLSFCFEET